MYLSRKENWLGEKRTEYFKADVAIKRIHLEVDRAHQFLYIINDTLQKCEGVGSCFEEGEQHDVTLVFQAYDDVQFPIGYADIEHADKHAGKRHVDKWCYLLDSKFIYKRYFHFKDNIYKDEIFDSRCGKAEYYSSLFRLGLLKPYGESNEPLCKVCFDYYSKPDYKKCFCISSDLIDFDMQKMRIY